MPRSLPIYEFVAMTAMLFATVAFATDAMLPAFPFIAAELAPDNPNRVQLLVSTFMLGLGVGTFIAGPLADAYGRKSVVIGGAGLFILGSLVSYAAPTLEVLLLGRVLQGLGAAGPRIGPLAMMRDLFEGRRMAQLSSIIMAVFMLFPAVAPLLGSIITNFAGWHAIFLAFAIFSAIGALWMGLRQPETLPVEKRRPIKVAPLIAATREIFAHRMVMLYTLALTLGFSELLVIISSIQPVYDQYFDKAAEFPIWFALGALVAASGTVVNAALVMRLGMRRLAYAAFGSKVVLTLLILGLFQFAALSETMRFVLWFVWSTSVFFMAGLIFGNLNALALQPLGHIAGTAASLLTGLSTVGAALLAIPTGWAFDGTPVPIMIGNFLAATVAYFIMRQTIESQETA